MTEDIRIYIDNEWHPARDYQKAAFMEFKKIKNPQGLVEYDNKMEGDLRIKFYIVRQARNACYILRENCTKSAIADCNDVKVYLTDHPFIKAGWFNAKDYLTWAYFYFVYSYYEKEMYFKSKGSTDLLQGVEYIEIPIDNLPPNIIFKISINNDDSIYYERNDACGIKIPISNNEHFRQNFLSTSQTKEKNIQVFIEGKWCPARSYQEDAFIAFQKMNASNGNIFEYDNGLDGNAQIKFSIVRDENNQCWIIRTDGTKSLIADLNDV